MSRWTPVAGCSPPGFPRVSGDEPVAKAGDLAETVFSPRERG